MITYPELCFQCLPSVASYSAISAIAWAFWVARTVVAARASMASAPVLIAKRGGTALSHERKPGRPPPAPAPASLARLVYFHGPSPYLTSSIYGN